MERISSEETSIKDEELIDYHNYQLFSQRYSFQEAKAIISSEVATFEDKERAWLSVAMSDDEEEESLNHVTYEDIEKVQIQLFKRDISLHSNESVSEFKVIETPDKNINSSINLKQKSKSKSILGSSKNKSKSKDSKSYRSKNQEKKTVRKKVKES